MENSFQEIMTRMPEIGEKMHELMVELFPICRSITGNGLLESLKILNSELKELKIKHFYSGTKVFDWIIPPEWNIKDAYVIDLSSNKKIIDLIGDYKGEGYQILLATGAPQSYAEGISNYLGLFDKVIATDNQTNNVGENKLNSIKSEINGDFIYAGDSKKDLPIWLYCKKAIIIGDNESIQKTLETSNVEIVDIIKEERSFIKLLIKQLRIHQWVKNILLFVPALASHQLLATDVLPLRRSHLIPKVLRIDRINSFMSNQGLMRWIYSKS